jgi:drug/metabolite transporter (DMT)-like permease
MAAPFLLFPVAQQWIDSSLAGMINGAAPLFTVAVAAAWYRTVPGRWQLAGLATGFAGIIAIFLPTVEGAEATALGAGLILLATLLYGVAYNLAEPLQRRNGGLPVVWRALLVTLAMIAPFGLFGLVSSSFAWQGIAAMAALGVFGSGLAFVAFATLVGRVGAARASVTGYCIPVVAIVLGVVFRGESVGLLTLSGAVLVLIGAWLTSRRQG